MLNLDDLDDLYVRPGHRDAGAGRQLMAALAALAAPGRLLIRWGMEVDNVGAQRASTTAGATLRPKILAVWPPSAYADLATGHRPGREPGEIAGPSPVPTPNTQP